MESVKLTIEREPGEILVSDEVDVVTALLLFSQQMRDVIDKKSEGFSLTLEPVKED